MIALSSDTPNEEKTIAESLALTFPGRELTFRSPLDLLLTEKIGAWTIEPIPTALVAIYNKPFRDLKIIAELKKIPEYQWVPVLILVKEKIKNIRVRFLEVGVTEVLEKPAQLSQLVFFIEKFLKKHEGRKMLTG